MAGTSDLMRGQFDALHPRQGGTGKTSTQFAVKPLSAP